MKEVFFSSSITCKNMTSIENSSTKLVISGQSNRPTKLQHIPILMYTKSDYLAPTSNGASSFDIQLSSLYFHLNIQQASQSIFTKRNYIFNIIIASPHFSNCNFHFYIGQYQNTPLLQKFRSYALPWTPSLILHRYFPVQVNLHLLVPLLLSFIPWIIMDHYSLLHVS